MLLRIFALAFQKSNDCNSSRDDLLLKSPAANDFVEERVYSLYAFSVRVELGFRVTVRVRVRVRVRVIFKLIISREISLLNFFSTNMLPFCIFSDY